MSGTLTRAQRCASEARREHGVRGTLAARSAALSKRGVSTARPHLELTRRGAPKDYGYNPEGRPWLESVAVNGAVVSAYGYDANGNRTSAELNWSSLGYSTDFDASLDESDTEYDAADKLLRYGTKEYTWNSFGQLSSVTDSASNETTAYEYDLYGNLLSVALPDGRTIEYDVDGAGRRVGRHVLDASGNELEFRGWIYRDLLRPIAEVDALGNVVARYVYSDGDGSKQNGVSQLATRLGANQDTSLPFSGRNVPEAIELVSGGVVTQRLNLITNQVGTVLAVVDAATGDVVQRREYDEFGRVLTDSAPGLQPFGFAGGLTDEATELVRFGARDYSPSVGRWLARDPVRWHGRQANLFVYVGQDPLNRKDLSGTDMCSAVASTICNACARITNFWLKAACYASCAVAADSLECPDLKDDAQKALEDGTGGVVNPYGNVPRGVGLGGEPNQCPTIDLDDVPTDPQPIELDDLPTE